MGWGTSFNTEIYLSKQLYYTMSELEDAIREREEDINRIIEAIEEDYGRTDATDSKSLRTDR